MKIINRVTGSVIFESEVESITLTLMAAIAAEVNLNGANLSGVNLMDANLSGANLRGVNLSETNLSETNLSGANLRGANLRGANLSGANLSGATLSGANLRGVNLIDANLSGANLREINLREANLSGANLSWSNLRGAIGNKRELRTLAVDTYSIAFTSSVLQIGCKRYTHQEWGNFTDDEIAIMDSGALEWWKKWKLPILNLIELSFGGLK